MKDEVPFFAAVLTYLSYAFLSFVGHFRDFLIKLRIYNCNKLQEKGNKGFVPLYNDFGSFWKRNMYLRIRDCWNRPICSVPGTVFTIEERISHDNNQTFEFTGKKTEVINIGSYNYLGFGENNGPCHNDNIKALEKFGVSTCSPYFEFGTYSIHDELNKLVAQYIGTEEALCFPMGFATNSCNIPAIAGKGTCFISDQYNHASLIHGIKLSGGSVKIFKHNDMQHLERTLRDAIVQGQDITHRPWKKIIIIIEGIYSMEGNIVDLKSIIELKKKYKAYLYLDEAHSIGAMGKTGRGIVEYFGANVSDVDIMMGTFTKSFGSMGGYIAGSKKLIRAIKKHSYALRYGISMPPVVASQIISSLKIIMGLDGTKIGSSRIETLAENCKYFHRRLKEIGFSMSGHEDSPVKAIMIYLPGKIAEFSRELLKRGIAIVVVGFPATSIVESRARICLSAGHTREMLDEVLSKLNEVADLLQLKYKKYFLTNLK